MTTVVERVAWHPVRDGLIPITNALEWFVSRPISRLPSDVQYLATCPSLELLDHIQGRRGPLGRRVEMVRRWLQFNGHEQASTELSNRVESLLESLRLWEASARSGMAREGFAEREDTEVPARFSEDLCERYDGLRDEAEDLCGYVRQLVAMLKPPEKKVRSSDSRKRTDEPTEEEIERVRGVIETGNETRDAILQRLRKKHGHGIRNARLTKILAILRDHGEYDG